MNSVLQVILVTSSVLFLAYIINMVRIKKLELKYILIWILTSVCFIVLAVFPRLLSFISRILHIIEPVNALYLMTIFLLLLIVFTLTVALSRNSNRVKTLTQDIGLLKLQVEKLSEDRKTQ